MRPPERILEAGALFGTPVLPSGRPGPPTALYVHIPFCLSRCHYCDFVTYTSLQRSIDPYTDALTREIAAIERSAPPVAPLQTLYVGGGTPSLLAPDQLERILGAVRQTFPVAPDLELTLEANPGDVSLELLSQFRLLGVNRLSLGMQSSDQTALRLLGRRHTHDDTRRAVHLARLAGIANVSLDLIYGLPGQALGDWAADVEAALALEPEHLSAYCLTIEPGTKLAAWARRGEIAPAPDDLAAEMLEWLEARMERAGYTQYEISNWAAGDEAASGFPRFACRHNLTYWLNQPYLGVGAGAHGYASGARYANVARVADYIDRLRRAGADPASVPGAPAAAWSTRVGEAEASRDTLLLGLRLTVLGVSADDYRQRHGAAAWEDARPALDRLAADGLVEWAPRDRAVRLTPRGRLLGNRVFAEFA